jgi:hypothetical protein
MSAKAETLDPGRHVAPLVLVIVLALTIGVAAGALITRAATSDTTVATERTTTEFVTGIQAWDQQKLDAMEGRQAAETFRSVDGSQVGPQGGSVGAGVRGWDQGMVDAMEDYQSFYGA